MHTTPSLPMQERKHASNSEKGAEDPHGAQGTFTLFSHTLLVTMRMTTMMILIPLVILRLLCAKNYVKRLLALYQQTRHSFTKWR